MKWKVLFFVIIFLIASGIIVFFHQSPQTIKNPKPSVTATVNKSILDTNPLMIDAMRKRSYPGSRITIERTLESGSNYHQYITSYISDGLKIYALLTVPLGEKPKSGWPIILFNHGYIAPETYQTAPLIGQYATYLPVFAQNGYIVFKPDYRGHGNSDGNPEGGYFSPAYTIDDLNALASIKKYPDANANKIGVWGHSMGGAITLRDLVVNPKDIKAAVIWGGVVGSYTDLFNWHDPNYHPSAYQLSLRNKYRSDLVKRYGTPQTDPTFWNSIDPTYFVSDITAPVQLHAGESDEEVPVSFSKSLYDRLKTAGKTTEFYTYPGANHNITQGFDTAMQRSLEFFNKYLK